MEVKTLKRSVFQRILGICATKLPQNPGCWKYENGVIIVDIEKSPELVQKSGALRIESKDLPKRVLLVHGEDDNFYAVENYCSHGKRRLDPVPGTKTIQCCSMGRTNFEYNGKRISGSEALSDIKGLDVVTEENILRISIN